MGEAVLDTNSIASDALRALRSGQAQLTGKPKKDLSKIPLTVCYWHILVEPVAPSDTLGDGVLAKAGMTAEAEQYMINMGKVLACGPAALKGKTESDIPLTEIAPGIERAEDLVGKTVVYQKHTGTVLRIRGTDQQVLLLTATEILAITDDPNFWVFYL